MKEGIDNAHKLAMAAFESREAPQSESRPAKVGDIESFKKQGPRPFKVTEGIIYADEWLDSIERLLSVARLPEDLKSEAVGLQLQDVASIWYRNEPRLQDKQLDWNTFKKLFRRKFFPTSEMRDMERQFQDLKQGSMTVSEYVAEFGRLSRFAKNLVADPKDRAERFRYGLREEIRTHVIAGGAKTYERILIRAQEVEKSQPSRSKREYPGNSNYQGNQKKPHVSNNNNNRPSHQQHHHQARNNDRAHQKQIPICDYCKRPGHQSDICRKRLGHCLVCGSATHQVKDCPKSGHRPGTNQQKAPLPTQQQQFGQHQQKTGRAYALAADEQEPEQEPTADVITGNTEDDELFFNNYYDPVLYPVTVPEPSPEDADPEATEPDC
ncbi:uncharacterized protein M6B38_127020 [Iris pallida]|uniref:CCHC-type domain-containing protein n=1 Tax=Iris pallida TaxID=29817 RepID=A0AAX6GFX7_IRIPA|nr:uncharacterized protein M6B38_127020 [Iris pallida]